MYRWQQLLLVFCVFLICSTPVFAIESEDSLDYREVQEAMNEIFPKEIKMSFSDLVQQLIQGDFNGILEDVLTYLETYFFYEIRNSKDILAQIIAIVLISAVFTNFSMAFTKTYIAETGFYLTYMLFDGDFSFRRPHIASVGRFKTLNVKDILIDLLGNPDRLYYDGFISCLAVNFSFIKFSDSDLLCYVWF